MSHKEIYDSVAELNVSLATLSGKLDALVAIFGERQKEIDRLSKGQDAVFARIRKLENMTAATAVVGIIALTVIPLIFGAMRFRVYLPTEPVPTSAHQAVR